MKFSFLVLMCLSAISGITDDAFKKDVVFKSNQSDFTKFSSVSALRNYAKEPPSDKTLSEPQSRKVLLNRTANALKMYYNPSIIPDDAFVKRFSKLFPATKTGLKEDLFFLSYKYKGSEILIAKSFFRYVLFIRSPEKIFENFPKDFTTLKDINYAVNIILNRKKLPRPEYYPLMLDRISENNGIIESTKNDDKFLAIKFYAVANSVAVLIDLPLPKQGMANTYFADRIRRSKEPPCEAPNPEHAHPRPDLELRRVMMFPPFAKDVKKHPIAFISTKKENDVIFRVGDEKCGYKVLSITPPKEDGSKWQVKIKNIKTGKITVLEK